VKGGGMLQNIIMLVLGGSAVLVVLYLLKRGKI